MIYLHLATGFEEIEALTCVDILRRAGMDVNMVSVTDKKEVTGAHGIPVTADLLFGEADYDACGMILLPGGMPGSANLFAHQGLCKQILRFQSEGKWLAAICAAPGVVLGQLGILKGKKAVCYPGFESDMTGAEVATDPVALDGKIITSRGPGTAYLFAFKIVELLASPEKANELKSGMLFSQIYQP